MARGSIFYILREDKDDFLDDDMYTEYIKKHNESYNYLGSTHIIPEYLSLLDNDLKTNTYSWFNTNTKQKYTQLIEVNYNSIFTELKEHWYCDPYGKSQFVLDEYVVYLITSALSYLFNEKYDSKLEDCLDNEYIKVLGANYPPYIKYYYNDMTTCSVEYEDNVFCLKRTLDVMKAYKLIKDEASFDDVDIILIYNCWG